MSLEQRLDQIESLLRDVLRQRTVKEWYSTSEIAQTLGRAEWTVRNHCRLGRIAAKKIAFGRGGSEEWRISHEELLRIQREGLLPNR